MIPVKALSEVKSRLASHLSLRQRENLVLDMLHHVIRTLHESTVLEHISVVSPDERVLAYAQDWGASALREEVPGHNAALHAATLHEQESGTMALLTIAADLPLLQAADIRSMVERSSHYSVVLAPSREGTGTNAILLRPPLALPYLFGPHSLSHYQQAARQARLSNTLHQRIGLALDIDTIDDLDDLYELQILSGEHISTWQETASCQAS